MPAEGICRTRFERRARLLTAKHAVEKRAVPAVHRARPAVRVTPLPNFLSDGPRPSPWCLKPFERGFFATFGCRCMRCEAPRTRRLGECTIVADTRARREGRK